MIFERSKANVQRDTPKRGARCPDRNDGTQPSAEATEALISFVHLPSNTVFRGSENSFIKTSTEVKMTSGYTDSLSFFLINLYGMLSLLLGCENRFLRLIIHFCFLTTHTHTQKFPLGLQLFPRQRRAVGAGKWLRRDKG